MADLGGGTGHLAIAACERYPELRAVVFDLPDSGRNDTKLFGSILDCLRSVICNAQAISFAIHYLKPT